jgi:methionyl-tRNA synthetase
VSDRVWITATPPTPNGDLHLGHLAGPYVAADVLRRFLRADGVDVAMTTGLDDHQSYVHTRALAEGSKPDAVAEDYGGRIAATWRAAGVEFDRIVRPRADEGYAQAVSRLVTRLHADGAIVSRETPLPYCTPCERWLYEAYVVGGCPHCGAGSNGNACEACGRPNACADLVDPRCVVCGAMAEVRDCVRLLFPLAPYAERLAAWWDGLALPPHVKALCDAMLRDGLPDIAVTHPSEWGVRAPVAGFGEHRVYVWFEMAAGYLAQRVPGGSAAHPVQLWGFDNAYFHTVLFPAVYLALGEADALPSAFLVNEFYRLEGEKFSTSRRHAVWADQALAWAGQDVVRLHVLRDRPRVRQTSFRRSDLDATRRHLDEVWNAWLGRLFGAVRDDLRGVVPTERPAGASWELLRSRLESTVAELREAYSVSGFDTRRAVALLDEVVRLASDYGDLHVYETAGLGGVRVDRGAIAAQLSVARALAAWAAPVMPSGAARLARALGIDPGGRIDASALDVTPPERLAPVAGAVFGSL